MPAAFSGRVKDEPASSRLSSKVPFSSACPLASKASESVEAPPRLTPWAGGAPEAACWMRPETASTVLAVIARMTWGSTDSTALFCRAATTSGELR